MDRSYRSSLALRWPPRYASSGTGFVVTAGLPGPSQFFGEYVYYSQAGVGLGAKSLLDFGYVRDFGRHVQLDVEYGLTPTLLEGQQDHYAGAGASFLF